MPCSSSCTFHFSFCLLLHIQLYEIHISARNAAMLAFDQIRNQSSVQWDKAMTLDKHQNCICLCRDKIPRRWWKTSLLISGRAVSHLECPKGRLLKKKKTHISQRLQNATYSCDKFSHPRCNQYCQPVGTTVFYLQLSSVCWWDAEVSFQFLAYDVAVKGKK